MKSNYTEEQLINFSKRCSIVHQKMKQIIHIIGRNQNGIALHEINKQVGVSAFIRDKCIAALEFSGFIKRLDCGTEKICELTEEGKRLQEIINK